MRYKFLSHTADIKFRAFGESVEKVFENSALALAESISQEKINSCEVFEIEVEGKDLENLLYNFLEEFLVFFDSDNFILSKVNSLSIEELDSSYSLNAEVWGDDVSKYEASDHIKAITYNDMFVKKEGSYWISQVVLDV